MRYLLLFLSIYASLTMTANGLSERMIKGPVSAELIRVVDGDTILVHAFPWPHQAIRVYVRLRDIDTPELKSSCAAIRRAAHSAKDALAELLTNRQLYLFEISNGKYSGRVIAHVQTANLENASHALVNLGHAVAYGGHRAHWAQKFNCQKS